VAALSLSSRLSHGLPHQQQQFRHLVATIGLLCHHNRVPVCMTSMLKLTISAVSFQQKFTVHVVHGTMLHGTSGPRFAGKSPGVGMCLPNGLHAYLARKSL
jgi:hypothetical protein